MKLDFLPRSIFTHAHFQPYVFNVVDLGILMLVDDTATSGAFQISHRLASIFSGFPKRSPRLPLSILATSEAADSAAKRALQVGMLTVQNKPQGLRHLLASVLH